MNMEQKVKIFLDILRISYFRQKPLNQGELKVGQKMIESAGLNIEEVFNFVCPYLENKGYLISYSQLIRDGKDWSKFVDIKNIDLKLGSVDLFYFFKINEDIINNDLSKIEEEIEKKGNEVFIDYNIDLGQFTFNKVATVEFKGIQKDVSDSLVEAGKNKKISWDIINDKITGGDDLSSDKEGQRKAQKKITGAVSEINKKTVKYLKEDKKLIKLTNSEYWLQYDVAIDG